MEGATMTAWGLRKLGRLGMASLIGLGAAAAAARGQTAYLVMDLNPGEKGYAGSSPSSPLAAGNHLFFVANPLEHGDPSLTKELWVTDGTAAGTQQLPTACLSGFCAFGPQLVASLGGVAFLDEETFGPLWRTDGTRAGTFPLPLPAGKDFATLGGSLYYLSALENSSVPEQLWRTDGTAPGSRPIVDLQIPHGVLDPWTLLVAGGKLVFLQPDPAPNGTFADLWASDGTAPGTGLIASFPGQNLALFTVAGNRLFFDAATPPNFVTTQIWVSDGTAAGTKLATPQSFSQVAWLKAAGNRIYFEADDGTHGVQIWTSDGTAAGTRQLTTVPSSFNLPGAIGVAEAGGKLVLIGGTALGSYRLWVIAPGSPGSVANLCPASGCGYLGLESIRFDSTLVEAGGRVLVAARPGEAGFEQSLWVTDGTPGGTALLKSCSGYCFRASPDSLRIDGALYFTVQESDGMPRLWRTDGTPGGTRRFASTPLEPYDVSFPLAALPGKVFFNAPDVAQPAYQDELFVSDGTAAGTHQLTDTTDPLSSSPAGMVAAGNQLFFTASSPTNPEAFWRSAGTAASTLPAAMSPAPGTPLPLPAFGGVVFLQYSDASLQLWRSDGTAAGSLPLTSFSAPLAAAPVSPVACGTGVCFAVADGGGGEVWRSDGTPQGTAQLFTLPASGIEGLAALGSDFYLELDNAQGGTDFWHRDGTTGGTVQLTDLGAFRVNPAVDPGFVRLGSQVYFLIDQLEALWQTDGTKAGTVEFRFGNNYAFVSASNLMSAGGALYLFAAGGLGEAGLWRSDGTAAGTVLLHPFQATNHVFAGGLTRFGSGFAFYADDGVHGSELWVTDGTAAGTRLVSDIQPGGGSSNPSGLVVAGGLLYFAADDGIHGNELWKSDGTAAGTRMVQDINPGPASSSPSGMTVAGNLLYFAADDGLTGRELWALPLSGPGGCQPGATDLCLGGGRFKVEAFWRDFQGNSGAGQAQALTGDTGTFWFFDPNNLELIVKVLDGRALDGHFWVFYGALSNVEYSLTVTDTATGLTRRYFNPLGELASVGDTTAFGPMGATAIGAPGTGNTSAPATAALGTAAPATAAKPAPGSGCQPDQSDLCLNGSRFAVKASWTDFSGHSGAGSAVTLTDETGYFWFFSAGNVETVLKVIDGRSLNGHFWVFYGALSNVHYTLTVTDTVTGTVKTYDNPAGQFASVADTTAF
jgi:ELWxxDGT repeat protein